MTTEQPPGAPSGAPAGEQGQANPYQELTNAYYAPNRGFGASPQVMWAPPPTRSWKGPIAIAALAVVMLGFGGVYGANEYAKHEICGVLTAAGAAEDDGTTVKTVSDTAEQTSSVEQVRSEIAATERVASLLVLDGDLRDAVNALTADISSALRLGEELKTVSVEERLDSRPRIVALAADIETHVNDVRAACDRAVS